MARCRCPGTACLACLARCGEVGSAALERARAGRSCMHLRGGKYSAPRPSLTLSLSAGGTTVVGPSSALCSLSALTSPHFQASPLTLPPTVRPFRRSAPRRGTSLPSSTPALDLDWWFGGVGGCPPLRPSWRQHPASKQAQAASRHCKGTPTFGPPKAPWMRVFESWHGRSACASRGYLRTDEQATGTLAFCRRWLFCQVSSAVFV